MKLIKEINAKRVGVVLAVVFILGLVVLTVYSRAYVERRKPLVHITLAESATLFWYYETRSTMRPATEAEREKGSGTEWVTEITVPHDAYRDYMGKLIGTRAILTTDGGIRPTTAENLFRTDLDNGDVRMVLGHDIFGRQPWDGEGVMVRVEHTGVTEFNYRLVPPSAVHTCVFTGEHYIYIVVRHDGAWGREHFARRRNVQIGLPSRVGHFVNLQFAVPEPIVYLAEGRIYDGANVRIFD